MTTSKVESTGPNMGALGFHHRRIAWASIFAGLLVAIGIQLLSSLLGIGIGMGAINPLRDHNPVANLGMGALLWWGITFLLALYAGGWVSGRLSRTGNKFETQIHGVLTWVLFVMVNIYLMTSAAGSILNTAGALVGKTDSATLQTQVSNFTAKVNDPAAEARARETANDVAAGLSKAGIFSFVGLLLGAFIASIGATMGRGKTYDDYDEVDTNRHRGEYITPRQVSPDLA